MWQEITGAANTFTPINLWDIELHTAGATTLKVPNTHNTLLLVQEGELLVNGTSVNAGNLIQFDAPTPVTALTEQAQQYTGYRYIELHYPATENDEQAPVKFYY